MKTLLSAGRITVCVLILVLAVAAWAADISLPVKPFLLPVRTHWKPVGCRVIPVSDPLLPPRTGWRNIHSDESNTDEVSVALAPVFAADWIAETDTWNPTGAVFDSSGHLYFSPFFPHEPVVLISLDMASGARRWAIPNTTGANPGVGSPMVLEDPDNPGEEIVYLGLYNRAIAVRTDGTIVWDVPTGLTGSKSVLGVNFLPTLDAIVGLAQDGFIYILDRRTGQPILAMPHKLPGAPSPINQGSSLPPEVEACIEQTFGQFVNLQQISFDKVMAGLLGNGVEVANFFSIDPRTGRLWVAATAPDEADGAIDGVSELGALYGLDVVSTDSGYEIIEACHSYFHGGSASTPALRKDGQRVYVGDNDGNLIAFDASGNEVWRLDIGSQIIGSVQVSSDNNELYVTTMSDVFQIFDRGKTGKFGWTATLDAFVLPPGFKQINLDLTGIGANGLFVQIGAGPVQGETILPIKTGIGLLDRRTGKLRWFAEGLDETVAEMNIGPDGAIYVGNSPLRRITAYCNLQSGGKITVQPPVGGISKFAPRRLDLLARDAVCAAADRAANAAKIRRVRPDSATADLKQIQELIAQALQAGNQAVADGDLTSRDWREAERALKKAEKNLTLRNLPCAQGYLRQACTRLTLITFKNR